VEGWVIAQASAKHWIGQDTTDGYVERGTPPTPRRGEGAVWALAGGLRTNPASSESISQGLTSSANLERFIQRYGHVAVA
jgi:hypothetical protein